MVNGNGVHIEKINDLIEDYQSRMTQDHINIIEMVLQIDNPRAIEILNALTKTVLKKSNSF